MKQKQIKMQGSIQKYVIWLVFVLVVIGFSIASPNFRTIDNFITILRQISMLCIMAVGMSFVLLAGGIDLTVGSQMSLVGVCVALMATKAHMPVAVSIIVGLLITLVVGFVNGIIVTKTFMPPLIATLAMQQIIQGIAYILCNGTPIYDIPESFEWIAKSSIGIIPVAVIIMFVILLIGMFILRKTYLGRYFYAVGSNEEATRLSGLNPDRIKIIVFSISGFLAGVAGLIMVSRVNSGEPKVGGGYEMDVLTACVVGGVSVSGGEGKISDVLVGSLIMGVLSNGLLIIGLNEYYQLVIKGLVLIAAVGIDCLQKHYKKN